MKPHTPYTPSILKIQFQDGPAPSTIARLPVTNIRIGAAAMLAMTLSATIANAAQPNGVAAFIRDHHLTRYSVAMEDLNGDGQPEALIYAMATTGGGGTTDLCGSGGCDLYVLALPANGYREVSNISISRPPIRVLRTITHGWHDLGVQVAGGGITAGYEARLRFNGAKYPSNPTVPPATRSRAAAGRVSINAMLPAPTAN